MTVWLRESALLGAALAGVILVAATGLTSPFGICAHVASDELLDATVAAGVGWIRIDFNWYLVEPEQDRFDWSVYDRLIPAARARGLQVFATVAYAPAWATDGSEYVGVPRDAADWHDLCYRAASRYRGQVAAWGMWNEPNLRGFWEGTRQQYVEVILRPGAEAIRAADPVALVAGPELAHLSSGDWDGWLEAILTEASDSLDVVTHHVYPSGSSHQDVTDKLEKGGPNPWDPPSVRSILRRTGWLGRPFWLTETGYPSARDGEYRQAVFYRDLVGDLFGISRELDWVDRVFFYQLEDDPRFVDQSWGIVTAQPGSQPKQAYFAYLNAIANSLADDAALLAADPPETMPTFTDEAFVVTVRNTGTTAWSDDAGHRFEATDDPCAMAVGSGRLDPLQPVPPGATATFLLGVRSSLWYPPRPPKRCTIGWRMVVDGDAFGDELRATIAVTDDPVPVIVAHPLPWGGSEGNTLVLHTVAASAGELTYRWQRNGRDLADDDRIEGVTTARLRIRGITAADSGEYRCVVGSLGGEVATERAAVTVTAAGRPEVRTGGRRVTSSDPATPPGASPLRRGGGRLPDFPPGRD